MENIDLKSCCTLNFFVVVLHCLNKRNLHFMMKQDCDEVCDCYCDQKQSQLVAENEQVDCSQLRLVILSFPLPFPSTMPSTFCVKTNRGKNSRICKTEGTFSFPQLVVVLSRPMHKVPNKDSSSCQARRCRQWQPVLQTQY